MTVSNLHRRAFLQARWREASTRSSSAALKIGSECLARQNIACDLCRDACPSSALRFAPRIPVAIPRVDAESCTACGDCIAMCPVGALTLQSGEAAGT